MDDSGNRGKFIPIRFDIPYLYQSPFQPNFALQYLKMETTFNFNNELSGKIALVTGGTKGTGKAIAQRLLDAGATVIITARNKPEEEKEGILFIPADLSQPDGTGNWSRKF